MPKKGHCPFCDKEITVGYDCRCGAIGIDKSAWLRPDVPLMRAAGSSHLAVMDMLSRRALPPDRTIREMKFFKKDS